MEACSQCNNEGMYEHNGVKGFCNYCLTGKLQAELKDLKDTVQLNCSPPDDCNDPVVLKNYMKACFEQAW